MLQCELCLPGKRQATHFRVEVTGCTSAVALPIAITAGSTVTCRCAMQADCMVEQELCACKKDMQRRIDAGLRVFSFPAELLDSVSKSLPSLSTSLDPTRDGIATASSFQLPFNIVAGNDVDAEVHEYWFVRKYK